MGFLHLLLNSTEKIGKFNNDIEQITKSMLGWESLFLCVNHQESCKLKYQHNIPVIQSIENIFLFFFLIFFFYFFPRKKINEREWN